MYSEIATINEIGHRNDLGINLLNYLKMIALIASSAFN